MTADDILDPNPFANPILADQGDATARDIYTAVGFALDRWEHCETSFGVLYSSFLEAPEGNHALMRSFGTILASSTRAEMIRAACDAFCAFHKNEELKTQTRHLLNLYKDAAARRNEIAHAMVTGESPHKIVANRAVPLPTIWFLVPPLFATRKQELFAEGPKYRYSTRELGHFTSCFEELGSRAMRLAQTIRSFRAALREKS